MRIRSVYPDFWSDSITGPMSAEAALLYIGLWGVADDAGRMEWDPLRVGAILDPYGAKFGGPKAIRSHLEELVRQRRIRRYQAAGREYAHIPTFRTWQKPNRPTESRLPEPPTLTEDSVRTHGALREDSLCSVDVEEGSVEEGRKEAAPLVDVSSSPQRSLDDALPSATPPAPPPAQSKKEDGTGRAKALQAALEARYRDARGETYAHQGAKDTKALKRLVGLASDAEIDRRWRKGLSLGAKWPGCSTFAALASKWNDLAAPANGNGIGAAPVGDFTNIPDGLAVFGD